MTDRRAYKAEHATKRTASDNTLTRQPPKDPKRKAAYEADPLAWLAYYLAPVYPLAWGSTHREMVAAAVRAIRTGHGMTVAAPRGEGKSSVLWGVGLWAIASGACRFPVVAAYKQTASKRMLIRWLDALASNKRLQEDYGDLCEPFKKTTHAIRLRLLTWKDGEPCGADKRIMDGVLVLPDGAGAIGAISLGGNARGLFASMPDGETLRPDVLLLDDPQDKKIAGSATLVRQTCERITSDLYNLGGPDRRLAIMAAVTVIAEHDVAEHLLASDDMEAIRVGQITEWPADYWDDASVTRRTWDDWNMERVEGMAEHDAGARAIAFYEKNYETLTDGMTVSWAERYDIKRGDPDAMYAAMWDFYRLGEAAFMSERQNQPIKPDLDVYDLTPAIVAGAVYEGRKLYQVPTSARLIAAATDLNHYGLHSVAVAFDNDQTGAVVWYGRDDHRGKGIVPKNCPEPEAKKRMFAALVKHGEALAAMPLKCADAVAQPGLWIIDGGYMPDVVRRYVEGPGRTVGMPVAMGRGYAADRYRPQGRSTIGEPREGTHRAESTIAGKFVAFNADYWREIAQRAWLATPGAPGGVSLYEGQHAEFGEHICREKLVEKLEGQTGPVWRWAVQPGWHDYGDALYMCYVAGVWLGVGTQGMRAKRVKRPRRVAKVPIAV